MAAQLDLTEKQIFTALRQFLLSFLSPNFDVIRSQVNKVAEPNGENFVLMTGLSKDRLSTNVESWDGATKSDLSIEQSTQFGIQLDVHGPLSGDAAQLITTLMRSNYGCEQFASYGLAVTPLYADDAKQMPFLNGEMQYEDRWVIMANLQVKPIVTFPQQYFTDTDINLVNVDAEYPPEAAMAL